MSGSQYYDIWMRQGSRRYLKILFVCFFVVRIQNELNIDLLKSIKFARIQYGSLILVRDLTSPVRPSMNFTFKG